jgi:hypothetical protein
MAHSDFIPSWPTAAGYPTWPGFWLDDGTLHSRAFFSDQDVYWEMDDRFADRDPDPTQGYPTGVRVKAMASNFENIPGGFIILHYRLINESPYNYQNAYAGFYLDPDIYHRQGNGSWTGRTSSDDMMQFNLTHQIAYVWDLDGHSGTALRLPYIGLGFVETPPASQDIDLNADGQPEVFVGEPTGTTGWHWFSWYFRPGSNDGGPNGPFSGVDNVPVSPDKEAIQFKLMAGDTSDADSPPAWHQRNRMHFFHASPTGFLNPRFDSNAMLLANYASGLDCLFIINCGPFNLDSGDSTDIVAVLIAAQDSTQLIQTKRMVDHLWQKQKTEPKIIIQSGNGGEVFTDNATITWTVDPTYPHPVDKVDIWLGYGKNQRWQLLDSAVVNTGQYTFSTQNLQEGVFYRIGIVSHTGEGFVYGASDSFFTISHEGVPASPEIMVIRPEFNDTLSGVYPAEILGGDADQDSVFLKIEYSLMNQWFTLTDHQPLQNPFMLDTRQMINGATELRFTAFDQNGFPSRSWKRNVTVHNPASTAPDSSFQHLSGVGNGFLQLNVIDPYQMTDHWYQLTFDASPYHLATLTDIDAGTTIASQINYINSPQIISFDGLSLKIAGFLPVVIDSSYWKIGNPSWQAVADIILSNPADYEIVFDNANPGIAYHPSTGQPLFQVPFQVFNRSFGIDTALKVEGLDVDLNGEFSSGDKFYVRERIIAGDTLSTSQRTFTFTFTWEDTLNPPQTGDIYRISTLGYFWEADTILFRSPVWLGLPQKPIPQQYVLYPNYPNPFNPQTTIRYVLPATEQVKIEVFNILGQRVKTLVDTRQTAGEHQVIWRGRNQAGMPVASGVYLLRMQAGSFVQTHKMLLLK